MSTSSLHTGRVWLENGSYSVCVCACLKAIASHNHPVHDRITGVSSELGEMTIIWMSDLVNWFWVSSEISEHFEPACPLGLGGAFLAAGLPATSRVMGQAMLASVKWWVKARTMQSHVTGFGFWLGLITGPMTSSKLSNLSGTLIFLICKMKC